MGCIFVCICDRFWNELSEKRQYKKIVICEKDNENKFKNNLVLLLFIFVESNREIMV